MKIAITGASGFVGKALSAHLREENHTIFPLDRSFFLPENRTKLADTLSECHAVINLAGANINHRWTSAYKKELIDSRVLVTRALVETINGLSEKPSVMISTSATGFLAEQACSDESHSQKGSGFLADLCEAWEKEARQISPDVRLVITRFGVVLAPHGGAFPKMATPCQYHLNVVLGSGSQVFSWIELNDLTRIMSFALKTPSLKGVVHACAPGHITQAELAKKLAAHFHTWVSLPMPSLMLRLLMGEAAEVITETQCALPGKLTDAGFFFQVPDIDTFLKKIQ